MWRNHPILVQFLGAAPLAYSSGSYDVIHVVCGLFLWMRSTGSKMRRRSPSRTALGLVDHSRSWLYDLCRLCNVGYDNFTLQKAPDPSSCRLPNTYQVRIDYKLSLQQTRGVFTISLSKARMRIGCQSVKFRIRGGNYTAYSERIAAS
jgi:hypothetical protein